MKSIESRTRALAGTCSVVLRDDIEAVVQYLTSRGHSRFEAVQIALDAVVVKQHELPSGHPSLLGRNRRAQPGRR